MTAMPQLPDLLPDLLPQLPELTPLSPLMAPVDASLATSATLPASTSGIALDLVFAVAVWALASWAISAWLLRRERASVSPPSDGRILAAPTASAVPATRPAHPDRPPLASCRWTG